MQKKGAMGVGMVLVIVLIAAAAVGAGVWFFGTSQTVIPGKTDPTTCADSTATLSFSAVDELAQATSVTADPSVRIDGAPSVNGSSVTSYPVGADLEILWSAGNYINKITTDTVDCGQTAVSTTMLATNTQTWRVFNTNGNPIADDGAGVNQSAIASGGSANLEIKLDGTDKQSSGDLIVVLEHTNTTAVDTLTLSGLGGANKIDSTPEFYSTSSAGSKTYVYEVPAVVGATTVEGTLGINLKSSQTYPTQSVKVTAYSKQAFKDTDGSFKVGVEDADATTKYEDTYDFTLWVDA